MNSYAKSVDSKNGLLFSIIIPTYNRPKELVRALTSIVEQKNISVRMFEIVVVNDGSVECYESVVDWSKKYKNIKYTRNEINLGVSASRNRAAFESEGEWIVFMDDDDEMAENYLSVLVENIRKYEHISVFWSGIKLVTHDQTHIRVFSGEYDKEEAFVKDFLSVGLAFGVSIKRECFHSVGAFNTEYEVGEDTELFVRIICAGLRVRAISGVAITKHEENQERLSSGFRKYSELFVYEKIFNQHKNFFLRFRYVYVCLVSWAMRVHLMNKNYRGAKELIRCLNLSGYDLAHILEKYNTSTDLGEDLLGDEIFFPNL